MALSAWEPDPVPYPDKMVKIDTLFQNVKRSLPLHLSEQQQFAFTLVILAGKK